mmetsp:Transcript_27378/g.41441  ORF Transcript_27378/g.41441 Transcript_27378/m.41441 type:complete len:307 (+) Transcript_27378:77-997(+)
MLNLLHFLPCMLIFYCNNVAMAFTGFHEVVQGRRSKMQGRTRVASLISDAIFDLARAYESAAESAGLKTDILTGGTINAISDTFAQCIAVDNEGSYEKQRKSALDTTLDFAYDSARTLRLSLFGLFDGAVSHLWFLALDLMVGQGQGLFDTVLKTVADASVYTPLWCLWFLAFMTMMKPHTNSELHDSMALRFQSIFDVWKSDWLELFRGNLGFFLPLSGLIYGFVPREERVLAYGLASLIYTTILSLWNQNRGQSDTLVPIVNMELCDVDNVNTKACVPVPRPPRAALPFRLRRVVVKARRTFLP